MQIRLLASAVATPDDLLGQLQRERQMREEEEQRHKEMEQRHQLVLLVRFMEIQRMRQRTQELEQKVLQVGLLWQQ